MTPVPFRIHWYSIGLVVSLYRARRAVHAFIFFTAIHSPITQSQITDYAYGTKRSINFSYDFRRNVNKRVVSWFQTVKKI